MVHMLQAGAPQTDRRMGALLLRRLLCKGAQLPALTAGHGGAVLALAVATVSTDLCTVKAAVGLAYAAWCGLSRRLQALAVFAERLALSKHVEVHPAAAADDRREGIPAGIAQTLATRNF